MTSLRARDLSLKFPTVAVAALLICVQKARPSVPTGLLHSRAGLCELFEPEVGLRAVHGEIPELAIVEPAQGFTRGVPFVARDHRREEAVDETAQARQPNRSSQSVWPGAFSVPIESERGSRFLI